MVEITFKSGRIVKVDAKEFSIRKNGNDISEISWDGLKSPKQILFMKLAEIESIIKVK